MKSFSVAEAKAKFSEVLELAASGEPVCVTRHGKPYVRLVADGPAKGRKPIDWTAIDQLRQNTAMMDYTASELIDAMYRRD